MFELLVGKLRAAAATASAGDGAARKRVELCEEKIVSLEAEISRLKAALHTRDGELRSANDELQATRDSAAAAKGKESDSMHAKDLQALRDDLAAAQSLASSATAGRDAVIQREADLLLQFEDLKRAFHAATEGAAAAAAAAPEIVEKMKKDLEAARLSEMSTRGELCLMKEQLDAQEQKLQHVQTQLQAEKQRGERLRREKEDLELANSCMKGEMSTMKRVTVNQDRCVGRLRRRQRDVAADAACSYEAVLADELCCMREAYEAKLKERCATRWQQAALQTPAPLCFFRHQLLPLHLNISIPPPLPTLARCSRAHLDREIQSNAAAM